MSALDRGDHVRVIDIVDDDEATLGDDAGAMEKYRGKTGMVIRLLPDWGAPGAPALEVNVPGVGRDMFFPEELVRA